jgi:uncharacterized integral membrane protein
MRRFGDNWQPILYTILIVLGLAIAWLIAFVIKNSEGTEVDFVFFATTASLVWVILISLGIGVLAGVLLSQLYRRGQRQERRQPADALADGVGADEAVGEPERASSGLPVPDEEVGAGDERHA